MAALRVRPRLPMEAMVDKEVHALPPTIPTRDDGERAASAVHWTVVAALVLLAVFVVTLPLAGLLGLLEGTRAGVACAGLALSTLIAAYLLGSD